LGERAGYAVSDEAAGGLEAAKRFGRFSIKQASRGAIIETQFGQRTLEPKDALPFVVSA
jgi:hypothetical protein